jgi:hypothetical protein
VAASAGRGRFAGDVVARFVATRGFRAGFVARAFARVRFAAVPRALRLAGFVFRFEAMHPPVSC